MEQQPGQQRLSAAINAPSISSFLSCDPSHLSIFKTLLESHVTGIDSEIRTEYENGNVVRFPVLTFCLDGLDRLLEKHELAKQMLKEKLDAEGGQPGVYGKLVQSLPIARTGSLSSGLGAEELGVRHKKMEADNAEKLAKLKSMLEAEYAEKMAKLDHEHLRRLAKLERKQQTQAVIIAKLKQDVDAQAAEELSTYKKDTYDEAKKAATAVMTTEFTKMKNDLQIKAIRELTDLKSCLKNKASGKIAQIRTITLAANKTSLESQLAAHNKNYRSRLSDNKKSFERFQSKWYNAVKGSIDGQNGVTLHLTNGAALKLMAQNTTVFSRYKNLCIQSVTKYRKDLKQQYQNHLNDVESECRQWLRANAGSVLRVEALDDLKQTLIKGKSYNYAGIHEEVIENVGNHILQEELQQETNNIMISYEAGLEKDVSEGGLGLLKVQKQDEDFQLAIQKVNGVARKAFASEETEMMVVVDSLHDSMVVENIFLGTPLMEIQAKTRVSQAQNTSTGAVRPWMQIKAGEPAFGRLFMRADTKENVPMSTSSGVRSDMRGYGEESEQVLPPRNVSSGLGGMYSIQLQPPSGGYAAKENGPMSAAHDINHIMHESDVHSRVEISSRHIKENAPSPELMITTIRPCQTGTTNLNVPSLQTGTRAQIKSADIPPANQTIKMEAKELSRQQLSRQAAPIFAADPRRLLLEGKDHSTIADMELHINTIWEEQPAVAQRLYSKQEIFERIFYGKTFKEIYEILGKRKRLSDDVGDENMPLSKKIDQHGGTKE